MRLIDADVLVKDIEEYQKSMMFDSCAERMHFDDMIDFAVDHLEEAPTINALPVVLCKDCENWDTSWECTGGGHFCPMIGLNTCADFYCGHGKKVGEEDDRCR